jgi:hypothetical protein
VVIYTAIRYQDVTAIFEVTEFGPQTLGVALRGGDESFASRGPTTNEGMTGRRSAVEKNKKLDAEMRRRAIERARQKQANETPTEPTENKAPAQSQETQKPQLDWPNITGADFDKEVGPYLAELGDTAKRILYLHKLWAEGREASDNHLDTFYTTYYDREGRPISTLVRGKPKEFIARRNQFFRRLRARLEKLYALQKIEEAEAARQRGVESEDKSDGQRWNNDAAAVALHMLLRAAGLAGDHNRAAVAHFASLVTLRSQQNMKEEFLEAIGGAFSDKTAEVVAEQFEAIGLSDLADDTRKKFTKL